MVSAIVCVDKNWGIGYQGNLLARIPEDMRFFRDKTKYGVIIMGRKTYDSLPSKPLPYKTNIVVTSKIDGLCQVDEKGTIFVTMDFIKLYLETLHPDTPVHYFVIGGGQIYKELLPYCNNAYVTKVERTYNAVDTYFPDLDEMSDWHISEIEPSRKYNGVKYRFTIYEREV